MFSLAGMRYNQLFDYSKRLHDNEARNLVQDTYYRLNKCVQETLQLRNQGRYENNDLTFPYFEPKWLTNSIHV